MRLQENNPIYVELMRTTLVFSQGVCTALGNPPAIKLLHNEEEKKMLLLPDEDGFPFAKPGCDTVTWTYPQVTALFRRLLPKSKQQGVTIYGEVIEDFVFLNLNKVTTPSGIWAKAFVDVEDKKGLSRRHAERMEELGAYYGTYPMADIGGRDSIERYNDIVHGRKRPRWTELDAIAEALEVPVEWLLFGTGEIWHPKW